MSLKSAHSWYQRYKDSPGYRDKIKRRRAAFKEQMGNGFVSLKNAPKKKQPRYGKLADWGYGGYKHNGRDWMQYHL